MAPQSRGSRNSEDDGDDEDSSSSSDSDSDDEEDDKRNEAVKAIDRVLKHWITSYARIRRCFREFGEKQGGKGPRTLSFAQADRMMDRLSEKLRLPDWLLKDQFEQLFDRFDFDGDGSLTRDETMRMVRVGLQQRRVAIAGDRRPVAVPEMTLEQSGYAVQKELGRGGQGIIYESTWSPPQGSFCFGYACGEAASRPKLEQNKKYCLKFYDKQNANACDLGELIAEYSLMKEIKSPAVAKTYEVFQDRSFYYLVGEPYSGGDFTQLAKHANQKNVEMGEAWWRSIFKQCLKGLSHLHHFAVMHCDIKEQNIMIEKKDDYKAPKPILIDFGLATKFGVVESPADEQDGVGSPAGTPGYIPPETWQTEVWYPAGDVFSMGVVFFQMLTARIPGVTSEVCGVFQHGDEAADLAMAARTRPFPWNEFPHSMTLLRELIEGMTECDRRKRLLSSKAVSHRWFESKSDEKLPQESMLKLVACCEGHNVKECVSQQLQIVCNLMELQALQEQIARASISSGGVGSEHKKLLEQHGVQSDVASKYVAACQGANGVALANVMIEETVLAKKHYSGHFVAELFDELDTGRTGFLSVSELRALLDSDAFECNFEDIDELMEQMDTDQDGQVSFQEFADVVLQDGRIARKADVVKHRWSCTIC